MAISFAGRPLSTLPHLLCLNLRCLAGYGVEWGADHWYRIETRAPLRGQKTAPPMKTLGDRRDAHPYEGTPYGTVNRILDSLPADVSDYVFVDYGSGKGRVILMASRRRFREVIGVEFAEPLHVAAEANIRRFRGAQNSPVRSVLCNAAEFDIPDGPCILYLYNPFKAAVVKQVARRVVASCRANPRHILVLYYNQTVFDAFEAEGWFRHTGTIREGFLSGLLQPARYAIRILEAR